jgi:membrane-bound ClpP family serine protease
MRLRTLNFAVVLIGLLSTLASADVLKVVLDDTIQAATAERVERALNQAATEKDDAVLI